MAEVFLGLGSNLSDPAEAIRLAVARLAGVLRVEAVSSLYRTEPEGVRDQAYFLNAVIRGSTELKPAELLTQTALIEAELGRQRKIPMGPRTIDIDLLLYDDVIIDEEGLALPHPRLTGRRFVLEPLAEIAPDVRVPGCERSASELLSALPPGPSVERLDAGRWPPPTRPI